MGSVGAFKAACLFVPQKVTEIRSDAAATDALTSFRFFSSPMTLTNLKSELPDYLAKAADVSQMWVF